MQMRPCFGAEEKAALSEYMDEDGFITEFHRTNKFERLIADFVGVQHCIVVNNGTISLTLAALAAGVAAGDEVIVPNYTMIATANAVKMFGARPVFVDIEPTSLCLDIDAVERAITNKTKAVLLVAANGRYPAAGIKAFEDLASKYGLVLLEDSAQALGSIYPDGRHVGTVGLIGSFSFSAPKIISTGQGGALVTHDEVLAKRLRKLKDFGRVSGGNDVHDTVGFNAKFTELQACVGIEQMKKLAGRISRKKEIWQRYARNLEKVNGIELFEHNLEYTTPWFIDSLVEQRENLVNYLKKHNIGTRVMYPPLNQQKAYNETGCFPVSELVGEKGLWLPSMVQLTNEQIDYITQKITAFYNV